MLTNYLDHFSITTFKMKRSSFLKLKEQLFNYVTCPTLAGSCMQEVQAFQFGVPKCPTRTPSHRPTAGEAGDKRNQGNPTMERRVG
jgi:hypothetical protein